MKGLSVPILYLYKAYPYLFYTGSKRIRSRVNAAKGCFSLSDFFARMYEIKDTDDVLPAKASSVHRLGN